MKAITPLAVALFLLCTLPAFSQQSSWQRVSPLPTIYPLNNVVSLGKDTIFSVGAYGTILTSFTGGKTWDVQEAVLADTDFFYDIQFPSSKIGYAGGDDGMLMKTTNGGLSWAELDFPGIRTILSICFVNVNKGWVACSGGEIYQTTDGGSSWTAQVTATKSDLFSIKFVNAVNGIAVGSKGTVLRTSDGGTTWNKTRVDTLRSLYSCSMVSAANAYAVGGFGYIIHSTDGGATWTKQTSPFQTTLYSVWFNSASLGWAVGSLGTVLRTSDGGTTWQSKLDDLSDDLYGVTFASATNGWAVGDMGRIISTTDGGLTWKLQSSGTMIDFYASYFTSLTQGYGVGDVGLVMKTNDGGLTWTSQNANTDQPLYDVSFSSAQNGVIAADSGLIFRTTDGGTTWQRKPSTVGATSEATLYGVYNFSADLSFVVGDLGAVRKSNNSGASWLDISPSGLDISLSQCAFFSSTVGLAVASDGTVLKTTNGGGTWSQKSTGVEQALYAIEITSNGIAYAVGDFGTIIKSTDQGENWIDQTIPTVTSFFDVKFYSPLVGWVVGDEGEIDATTDGGQTWNLQYVPSAATFHDLQLIRVGTGAVLLAQGTSSTIYCATFASLPGRTWTGAVSTDWMNPSNWTPSGVPGKLDSVYIPAVTNQPTLSVTVQQVNLGYLNIAAGATLTVGSGVGAILVKNALRVLGTIKLDPAAHTMFTSGGDLLLQDAGRVIGGAPSFTATGTGRIQGTFASLLLGSSSNMSTAGTVVVLNSLRMLADLHARNGELIVVRNPLADAFSGAGQITGGPSVQRSIAAGSQGYYRFESPSTVLRFRGVGDYPDSVAITTTPGLGPDRQPDSTFVANAYYTTLFPPSANAPADVILGYAEDQTDLSVFDLGFFKDSSSVLLNLGSTTWTDDPALGVELDSTMIEPIWYLGNVNYYPRGPLQFLDYVKVSDAAGHKDSLVWGAQPGATNGLDVVFGETALGPAPGAGTFDARWKLDASTASKTDVIPQLLEADSVVYLLQFQPASAGPSITLKWSPNALCAGDFVLRDADTKGGKILLNMRRDSAVVIIDPSIKAVEIRHHRPSFYAYQKGWNMVGYALSSTTDPTPKFNFPTAISKMYYFSSTYVAEDSMRNGPGYWLKFKSDQTIAIEGNPITSAVAPIQLGWNMIGSLTKNIAAASLVQVPSGILTVPLRYYGYSVNGSSAGYRLTDSLIAGHAYWIKSAGAGSLQMNSAAAKAIASESDDFSVCDAVKITDVTGSGQTLFIGTNSAAPAGDFELPPPPPSGTFDARFATQSMVERVPDRSGSTMLPLVIRDASYPVTIRAEFAAGSNASIAVVEMNTGKILGTIDGSSGSVVTLGSAPEGKIALQYLNRGGAAPCDYALDQNYPNPFNPVTTISFALAQPGQATLAVFNVLGQQVATLVHNEQLSAGSHQTVFDGSSFGSGVYFYRLTVTDDATRKPVFSQTRKLLLVK